MIRFELHFGLAVRRICCLPRAALREWIVDHCALEAYQLIDSTGYWNGVSEDSLTLVAIVPDSKQDETETKLKMIARQYHTDFSQDAVLMCWTMTDCTNIERINNSPYWKGNPHDSE